MVVFGALLGTRGLFGSPASSQLSRNKKHIYLIRLAHNNDILCLQGAHGNEEFLQAIQVMLPQFLLHGTFVPINASAGGSAICIHKNLLSEGAIVAHVITCQGRDHICDHTVSVSMQSLTKTVTLWKMRTNQARDYVNIGESSLRRVSKANVRALSFRFCWNLWIPATCWNASSSSVHKA